MSEPDLWDQVLGGGVPEEGASPPDTPEKQEEKAPEQRAPAAAGQPEEAEAPFVPFHLHNDTDISGMTDEQIELCFAMDPPKWLVMGADIQPTDENIGILGRAFVGRRNPVPIRRPGKEWHAEHRTLTKEDFVRHLTGKWLLGAYLLDENATTGVAVCDIDAEGPLKEGLLAGRYYSYLDLAYWARVVGTALSVAMASGVHVTLTGGKGAHAACVLPERAPAAIVRRQLHWMCVQMGLKRRGLQWGHQSGAFFVECFPKQDDAGNGLGNLIRLPNGTDPTTGRKCLVINDDPTGRIEDRTAQPMYRVDPVGDSELRRRGIQEWVDRDEKLDWLQRLLGDKYEVSFQRRCEDLTKEGGVQMRNAVGQAIHMAYSWDPTLASGLVSELEIISAGGAAGEV
jgi:hypothetical protein